MKCVFALEDLLIATPKSLEEYNCKMQRMRTAILSTAADENGLIRKLKVCRYYLGIDIGTQNTGYSILDENGTALEIDCIPLNKLEKCVLMKGQHIINHLSSRMAVYSKDGLELNWHVGVEDFLRKFIPGKSQSHGIFQLAQLNGIVSYGLYRMNGYKKPFHVHPTAARTYFDLAKSEMEPIKQRVLRFAMDKNPHISWKYNKTSGKPMAKCLDMADAFVISAYAYLQSQAFDIYECDEFAHMVLCNYNESAVKKIPKEEFYPMFLKGVQYTVKHHPRDMNIAKLQTPIVV